jgi:hypothetical protein
MEKKIFASIKNKTSFEKSECSIEKKLENPYKYVRRQVVARFMSLYEIFKLQLNVKGSVIECGVHHGGTLMSLAKVSTILEPYNYHRKIIGFDTFSGFLNIHKYDKEVVKKYPHIKKGLFKENYNVYNELEICIQEHNENRFLNNQKQIELVRGDANKTIPRYLKKNQHTLVSLLFLDFDIYKPTATALKYFLPRMSKGSIICFDEVNNPMWPGETRAVLEKFNINNYSIKSFEWDPNLSYTVL